MIMNSINWFQSMRVHWFVSELHLSISRLCVFYFVECFGTEETRGFIFLNSVYKFLLGLLIYFYFYPSHAIWTSNGTGNPFPSFKYVPSWFYDMHLWLIKLEIIVYMIIYYKHLCWVKEKLSRAVTSFVFLSKTSKEGSMWEANPFNTNA